MKITDLQPIAAQFQVRHPLTGEPATTDEGVPVIVDVVGRDSPEFYQHQKNFFRKMREMHAESGLEATDKLPKEVLEEMMVDNIATCVLGWDESVNPFFAPVDTAKGKGKYNTKLVRKVLRRKDLQYFRNQLDEYITDRSHFFSKQLTSYACTLITKKH